MSIRHSPAECVSWCTDELCPLVHFESWIVIAETTGEEHGPFRTHAEAIECNKRYLLPDT